MAPIAMESACYDNRRSSTNCMQDRCENKKNTEKKSKKQATEIIINEKKFYRVA